MLHYGTGVAQGAELLAQKKDECEELNKRVELQKLEIADLS